MDNTIIIHRLIQQYNTACNWIQREEDILYSSFLPNVIQPPQPKNPIKLCMAYCFFGKLFFQKETFFCWYSTVEGKWNTSANVSNFSWIIISRPLDTIIMMHWVAQGSTWWVRRCHSIWIWGRSNTVIVIWAPCEYNFPQTPIYPMLFPLWTIAHFTELPTKEGGLSGDEDFNICLKWRDSGREMSWFRKRRRVFVSDNLSFWHLIKVSENNSYYSNIIPHPWSYVYPCEEGSGA